MKVGLGGTFNVFHRGHRALIDRAFQEGEFVALGITSDRFAAQTREEVVPLERRIDDLKAYLETKGSSWDLIIIDTPAGGTNDITDIEALIVSPETREGAERINKERARKGLAPLRLIEVPHVLAEDSMPISSSRIQSGEIDREGRMLRPLRIRVGSDNPIKVDAVRNVLSQLFSSVEVMGTKVATSVPEQPFGEQTRTGAEERARAAIADGDYGVGLEAGVFETPDGLYDIQYCAVVDRRGRVTIGHGSGFRYPPEVADRVRGGWTVGRSFRELYGWERDGKKEGAISFLTCGALNRTALAEQAVMAAMVPRIRRDLYPDL